MKPKIAHIVGNGPSASNFNKLNDSDFVVGCNITRVSDADVTMLSDPRLCKLILNDPTLLTIPVIANPRVMDWLKLPEANGICIEVHDTYQRPEGVNPLEMSSAHYGVIWAIGKGYDEIHVWGVDSIYVDHINSHTDKLVPSETKKNPDKMKTVAERWRTEWQNIIKQNFSVNIIFHAPDGSYSMNPFVDYIKQHEGRVLLLNDTSDYHMGCEVVSKSYRYDTSIKTKNSLHALEINYHEYDKVILNGEGTMHHGRGASTNFLYALRYAQKAGCDTQIHNTVWQEMPDAFDDVLKKCSQITVREVLSQREIAKHGVDAKVVPDRSLMIDVPYKEYPFVKVYQGQYIKASTDELLDVDYPRINIFEQDWYEIVNRLRHCDLIITGRHHEMYAAIKARCRFIVTEGNTWKNRGLMETAGVFLDGMPSIEDALSGKYDSDYEKLFDYCNNTVYMV